MMAGIQPLAESGASLGGEETPQTAERNGSSDTSITSPLSLAGTMSNDSTITVRGNNDIQSPSIVLRTPSFPFPTIGIDSGTPLATPPTHLPFTALSPTVPPHNKGITASKLAKSRVVDEFKASGRISPAQRTAPAPNSTGTSLPDPFELSIRLQTEPGLAGWWRQLSQILRESFYATRATLAVPSDRTDIENVPWAQLGEYHATEDDDSLSRATAEAGSTRSSLSGSLMNESASKEYSQWKQDPIIKPLSTPKIGRPKLDSRHSYAGYPRKSPVVENPIAVVKRPRPTRAETHTSLAGGVPDSRALLDLKKLATGESVMSPLSEDTTTSSLPSARILESQRPLEADADPLITAVGVLKVLNNSSATILTRRYNILDEPQPSSPMSQKLPSRGSQTQLQGSESKQYSKTSKRARSGTSSTTRSSTTSSEPRSPYEDFEQIPGTPWAQSPAPSPAAMAETDDNPFFSSASVKQSFRKNPPSHQYTSGQQYEAIGVDTSYSIIQLPLIHPSTLLSQPQRLHKFRVDKGKERRGEAAGRSNNRQQSNERKRKVPLAILSILAPIIPYPQEYVQLLNSLSSMLATSFYAASQHSNLQKEISGLVQERSRATGRLPGRLHTESQGSEIFSPMSTSSAEYSANPSTPQGYDNSTNDKRGMDHDRPRVRTPGVKTPLSATAREGYFSIGSLHGDVSKDQSAPSRQSSTKSKASHSTSQKKPHTTLHSHGATFHKTHPSLPTAVAVSQSEDEQSESDAGVKPFKEPSTSMLRSMIDIGATQHVIAEPDSGRLLWVNSKFQAYRNNSAGQKLDESLWNSIYHKDRKNFKREWLHALETGEQLSQQVRMERFDGQFRWFHLKFLPLKNDLGVIKYWSGQAMDIHDLHEAEVKAAKSKEKAVSEAKYRAIANSLPVIVFAASVPAGMTFANTQWLSYSGQSLEQALGFGFLEHVHPEDLHKCRFPGVGGALSTSDAFKQDSKTASQRGALQRTDSATSSAGESDAASAMTDNTIKPVDLSPPTDSSDLQIPNELLKGLAKEGVISCAMDGQGNLSITTEMRLKSKDNEYRWHLVQGSYIQSVNFGSGEAQWFIACTDISAQKKNEAKIQEANSALENVNSALEREMQQKMGYLSSMSHEIRTPLNSIIGNLQFLIQSGLEESALEWAHGAKEAATGMHELINDILDLSKAEAKMLKLQPHWFNPRDIGEQIMDILNPKASGKKVELCQETSPDVPISIRGDSGRIKQVLLNLATNAIKFTNEGEVIVRCELQKSLPAELDIPPLKDNETFICWTVTDTGIGFTEADKKLLFKAYSQIKNKATRDTVGTGLGLILCKTMVNLHGGEIFAASTPGKGSTFSFFARFKVRNELTKQVSGRSALPSPAVTGPIQILAKEDGGSHLTETPASLHPSSVAQDSPTILSDSSSALSVRSSIYQKSIRSSISTLESSRPQSPLKLSMPADQVSATADDTTFNSISPLSVGMSRRTSQPGYNPAAIQSRKTEPLVPLTTPISANAPTPASNTYGSPTNENNKELSVQENVILDSDRANFRPPMLSILVICPPRETCRITCDRIKGIVPRSAPCNIASALSFKEADLLLFAEEPVLFTHVVIRTIVDKDAKQAIERILNSSIHSKACIVLLTDQDQFLNIKKGLPDLDFEALNQNDRVKKVLKPAHPSKLAKIFDPFNENRTIADDPKENKRKAGERRTKEDFKLFKTALGGKGIRVIAVEDDKMQMNILRSFLTKVCGLNTTQAFNGQDCVDRYLEHGPGHFSVIVSDTEMPIMNGLNMCRRIREEEKKRGWPPVNIVSLSANVLTKGWAEASEAGFSHYCAKPVSFSELGRILIELTDLNVPHVFLRDRPKPKALLKALGEVDEDEDDEDDDDDDDNEDGDVDGY